MLSLAEEILAELGYEPVGYDSPQQALAAFESQPAALRRGRWSTSACRA